MMKVMIQVEKSSVKLISIEIISPVVDCVKWSGALLGQAMLSGCRINPIYSTYMFYRGFLRC